MQEWKTRNGEESPLLSKPSAISIPPSLQLGTKLGGFFPLITASNVNQGARDGATAWDRFLGAGWLLLHVCPEQRALLFWCLSLANEKSPREKHIPGTAQQARIQHKRCELKARYSDNDHK